MSKRMNKERAREILGERKTKLETEIKEMKRMNKYKLLRNKYNTKPKEKEAKALDIAIESIDENERLKKERDYILEKAKAELKDNEWVDVGDRLPSESGYYLVSIKGVRETTTWFYGITSEYGTGWDEFEGHEDIIAWKPLPKPYERKEE